MTTKSNKLHIELEEAMCMVSGRKMVDGISPFNKVKALLPEDVEFISMYMVDNSTLVVLHSKGKCILKLHTSVTKRTRLILKGFGNA